MLRPDEVVTLFNDKLAGVGKIKPCPSFFLPMAIIQDFKIMLGYPRFDKLETWDEYFNIVRNSKFLTTHFTPSIAWLFKAENAFKVFSGQYDDKDTSDSEKDANSGASTLADALFSLIVGNGRYQYKESLKQMSDIDKAAISIFGNVSEIWDCNNFQASEIKNRIKNCYIAILKKNK